MYCMAALFKDKLALTNLQVNKYEYTVTKQLVPSF